MDLNLCVMQPLGYIHSMGLLDAALYFRYQFARCGARVSLAKNRLRHGATNLIFGAHLGVPREMLEGNACVLVNLEQTGTNGAAIGPEYLELLRRLPVIDYDADNLAAYGGGAGHALVSFGFAPYLRGERLLPLEQRPIDLLFFGSINERRRRLIERIERAGRRVATFDAAVYGPERDAYVRQAKAVLNCHHYDAGRFEQVRAFQVLSLGTAFVAERLPATRPPASFDDCVTWFADAELESFFGGSFGQPAFLQSAAAQVDRFVDVDPLAQYAAALSMISALGRTSRGTARAAPRSATRIHLGCGADYRPGWFNVDLEARHEPDALVDFGAPIALPLRIDSTTCGPVVLAEQSVELIHVGAFALRAADLTAMMGNCLALLKPGAALVIDLPSSPPGAGWIHRDQVRILGAESWGPYTDRFWEAGWFDSRFALRSTTPLDAARKPCDPAQARSLRLVFEKVATTVSERMTARTLSASFGGMADPLDPLPVGAASTPTGPLNLLDAETARRSGLFVYDADGVRSMKFGSDSRTRQSGILLADPDRIVLDYPKLMMAAFYVDPQPRRVLVIGLGGGTLPRAVHRLSPQATIDVVEIDPDVVQVARRFFAFDPPAGTTIHVDDGRAFVQRASREGRQYDLVMLDAFVDADVPAHMQTREFLVEVASILSPAGTFVVNTSGSSRTYDRETATYASVFGPFLSLKKAMRVILARRADAPVPHLAANAEILEPALRPLGVGRDWLLPLLAVEPPPPSAAQVLFDPA